MSKPLVFCLIVSMIAILPAIPFAQAEKSEAEAGYRHLNEVRKAAGMSPLQTNARLARAARNHARYMALHNTTGHNERRGRRGFTGVNPWDRALAVRYPHNKVSENVNAGSSTLTDSIDSLMTAIYHRFGFLAFDIDEVGLGSANRKEEGGERYVFKMGNSLLSGLCASPTAGALFEPPGTYVELCPKKTRFRAAFVEGLTQKLRRGNPRVVLWPPHRSRGATPVFYEESPDPLPDLRVSGNPLSVQFNPALVKKVRALSFRLYRHEGAIGAGGVRRGKLREVKPTRLMTATSDPNRKFSPLEFALFPLERMEWGQDYYAAARFEVDGREETIEWHFRTEEPGAPLYRIAGKGEVLPVRKGRTYAIYLPPTRSRPTLAPFRATFQEGRGPQVTVKDQNTILVRYEGPPCSEASFTVPGGGGFTVRMASEDNIERNHPPEVLYAGCGEYGADFRIAGRGERLDVRSGKSYRIHIRTAKGEAGLGRFRWSYPQGVKVSAAGEPGNILRVEVRGSACQEVLFQLSGRKTFKLRIVEGGGKGGSSECR